MLTFRTLSHLFQATNLSCHNTPLHPYHSQPFYTQTLAYLYYAHILPVAQQPRLLDNGHAAVSGTLSALPVLQSFLPAYISECAWLDNRTLLLFIDLKHPFDIIYPPGSHMVINMGNIVRELSPLPWSCYSVYRNHKDHTGVDLSIIACVFQ